jgi:hypothetical protein
MARLRSEKLNTNIGAAGGAGGLLSVVLVWAFGRFVAGDPMPDEVAAALSGLLIILAGYIIPPTSTTQRSQDLREHHRS